ncbi:MAG: tryptophan synthase, alpha subunit [Actinomycetota bacterium]|jgi:tryptophan synthase alpha chain
MSSLHTAFAAAAADNRAALIAYIPAGFPTVEKCYDLVRAIIDGGADVVEVGWPYSDPLMDGPTIQIAAEMALENGAHAADVFNTVSVVADAGAVPLVMSYWNLIERYGVERFSADLANANGVGVITADLTPEEAGPWIDATDANGIDRIFLVAPSSTDARLKIVTDATSGFVYAASLMGVTGTRASVSSHAAELVARTRKVTDLPIAVGLGVSTPEQAAEVAKYADGVIVGSAYIKAILDAPSHEEAVVAVRALSAALAQGVRR